MRELAIIKDGSKYTYIGMIEERALDNIRKIGLETYQDALTVLEAFGYKKFENTVYKD